MCGDNSTLLSELVTRVQILEEAIYVPYKGSTCKELVLEWLTRHKTVNASMLSYEIDGTQTVVAIRKAISVMHKQGILIRVSTGVYKKNPDSRRMYDNHNSDPSRPLYSKYYMAR